MLRFLLILALLALALAGKDPPVVQRSSDAVLSRAAAPESNTSLGDALLRVARDSCVALIVVCFAQAIGRFCLPNSRLASAHYGLPNSLLQRSTTIMSILSMCAMPTVRSLSVLHAQPVCAVLCWAAMDVTSSDANPAEAPPRTQDPRVPTRADYRGESRCNQFRITRCRCLCRACEQLLCVR